MRKRLSGWKGAISYTVLNTCQLVRGFLQGQCIGEKTESKIIRIWVKQMKLSVQYFKNLELEENNLNVSSIKINIQGNEYPSYPDVMFTHYLNVSNYHT